MLVRMTAYYRRKDPKGAPRRTRGRRGGHYADGGRRASGRRTGRGSLICDRPAPDRPGHPTDGHAAAATPTTSTAKPGPGADAAGSGNTGNAPRELAVCVDCGARPVDLHHLDYGNLGDKDYDALLPLCRRDHDRIHAAWEATPHVRRLGRRTATLDVVAEMRIRLGR